MPTNLFNKSAKSYHLSSGARKREHPKKYPHIVATFYSKILL